MIKLKQVMIAKCIMRKKSKPRLVVFQPEEYEGIPIFYLNYSTLHHNLFYNETYIIKWRQINDAFLVSGTNGEQLHRER